MKIALAQINPTVGDFKGNIEKMAASIEQAVARSCDLVVFSELVLCGYPPGELLTMKDFVAASLEHLERLIRAVKGIGVVCGAVTEVKSQAGRKLFNSALLLDEGRIVHQVDKRVLPCGKLFDERRYFHAGEWSPPVLYKGHKIALSVCHEFWEHRDEEASAPVETDPVAFLMQEGADLMIHIAASPYEAGKRDRKSAALAATARQCRVPLLYVNQVGGDDGILFDGFSVAVDSKGVVSARASDFEEDLVVFDTKTGKGQHHPVAGSEAESMLKALVMGTRDYAHKCGFQKALMGLSGGIDSALTACIAVQALGKENVTGVFMPSPYTSQQSYEDARKLAQNLEIEFFHIPISPVFDQFVESLFSVYGPTPHDLTEQNLQARVRATLLMAVSNRSGHLVLSTGNKSELAVGYCTLYGDLSGGLGVISDVYKTKVYELARLMNQDQEIIPDGILERAPTAELKPGQKDQDDLPPYDVLDGILKAYVEENRGPDEIVAMGYDGAAVNDVIRRVNQNEYKRHQAPLGLKVTRRSFGVERRFPVAGFSKVSDIMTE